MKPPPRLFVIGLLFVLAAPAGAAHTHRLDSLNARIAEARQREAQLSGDVANLTSRIRALEAQAGDVSTRLASLEDDLSLHRRRLEKISALLDLQTKQLVFLKHQYATATSQLNNRIVSLYEEDRPSAIEIVLGARSLDDVLAQADYMNSVVAQDAQIVDAVAQSRARTREARARTVVLKRQVTAATRVVAYRTQQARALRNEVLSQRRSLSGTRAEKQRALGETRRSEQQWIAEANALRAASAAVAAEITSAQSASSSPSPPSSSGLIWPVSGTITSPYGMRWGTLHPGLDIAAPTGTPIRAAAAGTVIVAAYSGGYGNLIVIDHANGLATAYAHQSRLAASVGQRVAQGHVVGYVGSTGFSTGPHLHFEVRANGSPVDPMGYL